jgi:hypothetical protein
MRTVDFIDNTDPSRVAINKWVEKKTNERIKDLLPEGSITAATRLVLTNAIFFKASWLTAFDEQMTASGDFTKPDGSTVSAELMNQTSEFPYADMGDFKAELFPAGTDQRRRATDDHVRSQLAEPPNVAPRRPAVRDIADQGDGQPFQGTAMLTDRQHVEQALRRMLMRPVAGVQHAAL